MTRTNDTFIGQQLQRIADALERAYPKDDLDFAAISDEERRLTRRLVETPFSGIHRWPTPEEMFRGEGDHILHDDGHEGEELDD